MFFLFPVLVTPMIILMLFENQTPCLCIFFQKHRKPAVQLTVKRESGKFICLSENCGKVFTSSMLLLFHQFSDKHLGLLCCVCNKTFSFQQTLRRHIKSAHLQEQHVCSQCPDQRSYTRRDKLNAHQLKYHGMIMCDKCGAGFSETKWLKDHITKYHAN